MINDFYNDFSIKIDTSACKSMIAGHDLKLNDTWFYSDQIFESGKIYGIVSEHGQGCEYLSYLLGGRLGFEDVKVYCNDSPISQNDLNEVSFNLEPNHEPYGKKQVKKSIESALKISTDKGDFSLIADRFLLTPERNDRKFIQLSGERWRAAAAFGYAQNKRIFFAPYETSNFYYHMCQSCLLKALKELTKCGALVILPAGSDEFIKHIADEVIYLNRNYDIDDMRRFYEGQFGEKWIH